MNSYCGPLVCEPVTIWCVLCEFDTTGAVTPGTARPGDLRRMTFIAATRSEGEYHMPTYGREFLRLTTMILGKRSRGMPKQIDAPARQSLPRKKMPSASQHSDRCGGRQVPAVIRERKPNESRDERPFQ